MERRRFEWGRIDAAAKKKTPWDKRVKIIEKEFPGTRSLDWKRAFDSDVSLMGRIIRDILKLDSVVPGRPGPRPQLDEETAQLRWRQLIGQDYSTLPFVDAFGLLMGERSIRHVASICGLDRNLIFRLKKGEVEPGSYELEAIAKAFKRDPSYFCEYRRLVIGKSVLSKLEAHPEGSIAIYRRLQQKNDA